MQAHGIQGMVLAIIKVLLRKSFWTKFLYQHLKLLKIIYKADTIRIEIMKLQNQHLHRPSSSSSYLLLQWWTVSWVSITEEQRWFEPIKTQLGIPDHTTYAGPRPTYTNLPSDPLNKNGSAPPENTVLHQSSPLPRGYTLFPPSLHSQCASSHSRNRIAKLRLTGVCG